MLPIARHSAPGCPPFCFTWQPFCSRWSGILPPVARNSTSAAQDSAPTVHSMSPKGHSPLPDSAFQFPTFSITLPKPTITTSRPTSHVTRAQKPRFCARNARKRGFQTPKAHKKPDFVLEMLENEGSEPQKRTKTSILYSGRGGLAPGREEISIGKHNNGLPANHRAHFQNINT